jgi:hypothetical protein
MSEQDAELIAYAKKIGAPVEQVHRIGEEDKDICELCNIKSEKNCACCFIVDC